jgi:hypothetical protein
LSAGQATRHSLCLSTVYAACPKAGLL